MTDREQRDPASPAQIPCILHQIFPAGEVEFVKQAVDGEQNGQHRKSCLDAHHAWEHRLWDRADAQLLVEHRYQWFWGTYKSYTRVSY